MPGRASLSAPLVAALIVLAVGAVGAVGASAQPLPPLGSPVNDFAGVIDEPNRAAMDRLIRALDAATTDAVVVVTVESTAPFADAKEYAVRLFEQAGIGRKGQDNGLLVLLAVKERQVRIEVGYGLEPIITDGFAGDTSRSVMVPHFRQGDYGGGLRAGVERLVARIADARGVVLEGVPAAATPAPRRRRVPAAMWIFFVIVLIQVAVVMARYKRAARVARRGARWGRGNWSGWSGGVGPFGSGSFGGGGLGGGGFGGGGFGGFGGGRSGGGGGGASW